MEKKKVLFFSKSEKVLFLTKKYHFLKKYFSEPCHLLSIFQITPFSSSSFAHIFRQRTAGAIFLEFLGVFFQAFWIFTKYFFFQKKSKK